MIPHYNFKQLGSRSEGLTGVFWPGLLRTTVNSRYLEVEGIIFYKFKLPEVQIDLHFG